LCEDHYQEGAVKRGLAITIFTVALCAASQASAQMPGAGIGSIDPGGDPVPQSDKAPLPPDPEGKAEDLRLQGKCQEAIPIFRRLSDGDDIAQYNLGLCLIDVSKTEPDPKRAEKLKHEGAEWIIQAANKGLPNAQSSLVTLYLDGTGVEKDPVEAGKWSLIYQENGARFAIGLPNISAKLRDRLDDVLTDETWAEARSRASSWVPVSRNSNAENY
jgi:hypothetical protein